MEFDFSCKECGSNLSADESMTGMQLNCPSCNSKIKVPEHNNSSSDSSTNWNNDIIPKLRPPVEQRKKILSNQKSYSNKQNRETFKSKKANRDSDLKVLKKSSRSSNKSNINNGKKGSGAFITILILLVACGVGFYFFYINKEMPVEEPPTTKSAQISSPPSESVEAKIVTVEKKATIVSDETEQKKYNFIATSTRKIDSEENVVAKVEYGTMDIEADLYLNKVVKVHYAIPYGKNGKPLPSASNVVYICPFRPERKFFTKSYFKWFPEKGGYTCFSMDIVSDAEYHKETEKLDYVYVTSGFPDLVFKVKEIIENHFGLEKRNILLTGQSAGTCMAKEMVEHF